MLFKRFPRVIIGNFNQYSTSSQNGIKQSPKIKRVKGMSDYIGPTMDKLDLIEYEAKKVMHLYGYNKIITPILEQVDLFNKGLGEGSEVVVGKELYELEDVKNGERIALRPEGTAGVVRAFINNDLQFQLSQKLYYFGPMFRRERPQKGRLRQFHQFGAECIGISSAYNDVELIGQGYLMLKNLGLADRVTLKINSIGDSNSRRQYVQSLKSYLTPYQDQLSAFSRLKLDINPIKILDSKITDDIKLMKNAPVLGDYLSSCSKQLFEDIQTELNIQEIPFEIDNKLVRGLDYYNDTVWEFVCKPGDKSLGETQCTVLGGGRYQGLIEKLSGKQDLDNGIPSIGWACGVERLALMLDEVTSQAPQIQIIPMLNDTSSQFQDKILTRSYHLANDLRQFNYSCQVSIPPKNSQKFLSQLRSEFVIFIGQEEVEGNQLTVKNWITREQHKLNKENLIQLLQQNNLTNN